MQLITNPQSAWMRPHIICICLLTSYTNWSLPRKRWFGPCRQNKSKWICNDGNIFQYWSNLLFLWWKHPNFGEFCYWILFSGMLIMKHPSLVETKSWCWLGNKLLSKQMMTQFLNAYMHQWADFPLNHHKSLITIRLFKVGYKYNK